MSRQRPGGVTLGDVAAAAEVSKATASRVLAGHPRVGPMYQSAVLAAAEQLGYARQGRPRRSRGVAVVLSGPGAVVPGSPYSGLLLAGITAQLAERDLQPALFLPQGERDEERLVSYLASGHADGVLACCPGRARLIDRLAATGLPVVAASRPPYAPGASYVDVDNKRGAGLAVAHLAEQGCSQVATIAGPIGTWTGAGRLAGYRQALAAAGLHADEALIRFGDFTTRSGRDQTTALLASRPRVDGLFVAGELMAYGALEALHQSGRKIPGDVAVVSFDDLPGAAATSPPLTSVHQPFQQMGQEMTRLLLALADRRRTTRHVILGTHLVVRQSSQRSHPRR